MKVYSFGAADGFPSAFEAPAFLIQEGKRLWLIDCPPQVNLFLREIDLSAMDLSAVLITHLHNDHIGGLVDLIQMRMICLTNRGLMKQTGYYQNIVTEFLPIYVFGHDKEWWSCVEKLIDFNCPKQWGDWRNFHNVILVDKGLEKGSIMIDGVNVDFKKNKHDVPCYGLKINRSVGISGDTPYDAEFEKWLCKEVGLVLHEAGFGGSHLRFEFLEKVACQHRRLYFYHIPSAARQLMRTKNMPIAEKGWLEVEPYCELFEREEDNWHPDWD